MVLYGAHGVSIPSGTVTAGGANAPVYYPGTQLTRNRTKNEQHQEVIEYMDKEWTCVVLKRVQTSSGAISDYSSFDKM